MSLLDFMNDLQSRQISLWLEDDQLRYRAPKGALTAELRAQILERRAELVQLLQEMRGAARPGLPPIQAADRRQPLPLSFSQERLWVLERMQAGASAYVIQAALSLEGALDRDALEQAFQELVSRHEILRTTFAVKGLQPVQIVAPSAHLPVAFADLTALSDEQQGATVVARRAELIQPFDLAQGPLVRVALLRLAPQHHLLLLALHHIIADGWSVGVIMAELAACYAARPGGAALAPLPVQYADFARWQRSVVQSPALESQRAYWRARLVDVGQTELIQPDRPQQGPRAFRGRRTERALPAELSGALRALASQHEATMFMLLLATLALLLQRRSGQPEVTVGSPVAGRTQPELEPLVGCFVNTLVFRIAPADNLPFSELLGQVRQIALEGYANQDLPFEQVLADQRDGRDGARAPLFQVFLNMLPFPEHPPAVAGLALKLLAPPEEDAKFDLTFYIEDSARLQIALVSNADLFTEGLVAELLDQFEGLLRQVSQAPEAPIGSFSLVTATAQLPDPALPLEAAPVEPVHVQFAEQARRTPERVAVRAGGQSWTYAELETRSAQLAHALVTSGLEPGQRVVIYAHRSAALPWALLAVFRAGAVVCVLDSSDPPERILACLHQIQPQAWLATAGAPPLAGPLQAWLEQASLIYRAELPADPQSAGQVVGDHPADPPERPVALDNWAYLAFTSGTTGQPKGIIGTHWPLAHFVAWQCQTFGLTQEDRFTMLSGLAHDPLLRDILTPLTCGASVHVPAEQHLGGGGLLEWLTAEGITVMHLTPSMSRYVLPFRPASVPGGWALRYAFFGGEPLHAQDIALLRQHAPSATCVNFYGLTETPQAMAYYAVPPGVEPEGPVPVGCGIDGVQVLVLNPAQRLAGVGEVGEIVVRTPYLALGYLDDPALTQSRFVTNPYTWYPDDRMLRTGDRGTYRADGSVVYLGRADRQVKLRGFRVELGEIEQHLLSHPAVRQAHVAAGYNPADPQALVAYLVLRETGITDQELRQHLRRFVPGHMVPSALVRLEQLPLTPAGKVDTRALPAYLGERPRLAAAYAPPASPVEQQIAAIWSQVLGVQQVGRDDSFFELGGHSLSATLISHRLEEQLGVQIPLQAIFEDPTVAGVAHLVEQQRGASESHQSIRPTVRGSQQIGDLLAQLQSIVPDGPQRPKEGE
ncbi:MAG: hypothetical protein OHK0022_11930 [Roseiflexaceae bacterium]